MEHDPIKRLASLDLSQPHLQTLDLLYPDLELAIAYATDLFVTHGQRCPLQ